MNKQIKLAAVLLSLAVLQGRAEAYLLPLTAFLLAAVLDVVPATVTGCLCGVATDMLTPEHSGYYAVSLTLACFGAAKLFELRWRRSWLTAAVMAAIGVPAVVVGYFLLFRLPMVPDWGLLFVRRYLPRIGWTAACGLPLYGLFHWLFR